MSTKLRVGGLSVVMAAAVLLLAACGGTESEAEESGSSAPSTTVALATQGEVADPGDQESSAGEPGEGSGEEGSEQPGAAGSGHGSATLTVGESSWSFDRVVCAFGEEMIGQEGAEFVLSAVQDGLQLYATIDSYGHSVSIDDIEDFENPSVSLESEWSAGEFIEVSGKQVQASALFLDYGVDSLTGVEGTLVAVCP